VRATLYWRAERRDGQLVVGWEDQESAAELAERLHRQRCKWATIEQAGVEIGGVDAHPETGKRTWWGEA
jgi:hypothetical protein